MPTRLTTMRALLLAGFASAALMAASPVRAQGGALDKAGGWHFETRGPSSFASGGSTGSYYFQATPGTAFSLPNGTRGFTDFSIGHNVGFMSELGLGDARATIGARVAEPLIANGFTPALEQRRYVGAGPRLGLEGSKPLPSSWVVEWQVGASVLFGDRSFDGSGAAVNPVVPNYGASSSVVNVDGLLGLSYFFSAASKLTLGYRADAYFNGTPAANAIAPAQNTERIDHGPMVRFTIQK